MSLPQFSARYHSLRTSAAEGTLRFQGSAEVRQAEADCVSESGCWWSGRGDSINTKLTREFDLTGLDAAALEYTVWHDIEDGWDYGYVEVSDDGGQTWNIIEGLHTSDADVSGNAYGPGYTGRSRDWKPESIDLTPFAGGPVLIRFEYVTDDAVYRDGLMVADISIPQLDGDAASDGWNADGFAPGPREPSPAIHSPDNHNRRERRIPCIAPRPGRRQLRPNHPDRPGHARSRGDHHRLPRHPRHPPRRNLHPRVQPIA